MVRNLEIIGEAAKHIPDEIRIMMPDIEWRKAAGLRDMLAHAYFGIDDAILWDVIQNKVPELEQSIQSILHLFTEMELLEDMTPETAHADMIAKPVKGEY